LQDLEPFLIALFFTICGLPFGICGVYFLYDFIWKVFWIWVGFWVQYFRMAPLLSGLAPFLDLGGFSRYFSEGVFGVCGGFLGIDIWKV
jgi:hypothetical protein